MTTDSLARRLWRLAPFVVLLSYVTAMLLFAVARRSDDTTVLRWGHVYETSSAFHKEALKVAEAFEDETNGRYRIKVYPASSLGNEVSLNEALNLGSVDLIYTGPSLAAQYYGPLGMSDFPYAIRDMAHWRAYRDSELFRELAHAYGDATGNEILALTFYGFRHVTSNRPIRAPEDMRNLKIRVPNAPAFMMMPQATGANPTPMPFSEVYLGLQQGVVESCENPLTTIYYKRFYEVQSHISLTGHIANSLVIIISGKAKNELPVADRALLAQLIERASARATEEITRQENELVSWYQDNGITIIEADREAFRDVVYPELKRPGLPFSPDLLDRLAALEGPGDG